MNLLENLNFLRGAFLGSLQWSLTANRVITLPDRDGTIALTSDLTTLEQRIGMIGTPYTNTPAANTNAVITVPAPGAGLSLQLNQVTFSYNTTPNSSGMLRIAADGVTVHQMAVTSSGVGPVIAGIKLPANTAMTITLFAAGAACTGSVNASVSVV